MKTVFLKCKLHKLFAFKNTLKKALGGFDKFIPHLLNGETSVSLCGNVNQALNLLRPEK